MPENSSSTSKLQNWSVKHENFFLLLFSCFLDEGGGRKAFLWSKSIRAEGEKYDVVIRNSYYQESVRHALGEPVSHTGTGTLHSDPSHQQTNSQVSLCRCPQLWRRECFRWNRQISLTLNTMVACRYFGSHQRHFDLLFSRTDLSRCFEPKQLNSPLLLNKRTKILLLWARPGDLVDTPLRRVCSSSSIPSNHTAQL